MLEKQITNPWAFECRKKFEENENILKIRSVSGNCEVHNSFPVDVLKALITSKAYRTIHKEWNVLEKNFLNKNRRELHNFLFEVMFNCKLIYFLL